MDFLVEFTISIRKSRFSSLACDPALSVPAQKCKTEFSQFAYLEKETGVPNGGVPASAENRVI